MKSKVTIGVIIGLALLAVGAAAYVLRPPAAPSEVIEAAPEMEEVSPPAEEESEAMEAMEEMSEDEGEMHDDEMASGPSFTLSAAESEARFTLDEELKGAPKTVIGVTNQVQGQIFADPTDLNTAMVGDILINARTLETDSGFRNRAIQNEILDTGSFEYVVFTPQEVIGLPASAAVGDTLEFQISGDLTIRDITHTVVFEVTAALTAEDRIEGYAFTTILREDYGLKIPSVPNVANVDEEVLLEIDFVAVK